MGYEINSPDKQVWLPLDHNWIDATLNESGNFKDFSEAYKQKYGIDLHDILKMLLDGTNYYIVSEIAAVSSYCDGNLGGSIESKLANFNSLHLYGAKVQQEETQLMAIVAVVENSGTLGHGFSIYLPAIGTTINSIDDLSVALFEV